MLYDIQTCLGLLGLMKEFYICGTLLLYYVLTNAISSQGQGLYVEPQAGTSFPKQTTNLEDDVAEEYESQPLPGMYSPSKGPLCGSHLIPLSMATPVFK